MSDEGSEPPGTEVAEEAGRTARAAIESWPKTARLGVLCLFAAGAFAVFYALTHSSREEPPQCRIDVVIPAPGKVGGELRV
ncbi:hypothetical protein [Microbispora sp. KK1-11]|uniref:hypothetical protein n=1 Tax=Microbispora sp. KK1-11 TaxID=2053005 RepID=UPI0011574D17|nr:hypothetical protein [Microbispora sp. KK1-11]TQS29113.1 hypothetical protein FLW16_12265 [Microbispora sp. KK1-11]